MKKQAAQFQKPFKIQGPLDKLSPCTTMYFKCKNITGAQTNVHLLCTKTGNVVSNGAKTLACFIRLG